MNSQSENLIGGGGTEIFWGAVVMFILFWGIWQCSHGCFIKNGVFF
jgi:hypothetical protein